MDSIQLKALNNLHRLYHFAHRARFPRHILDQISITIDETFTPYDPANKTSNVWSQVNNRTLHAYPGNVVEIVRAMDILLKGVTGDTVLFYHTKKDQHDKKYDILNGNVTEQIKTTHEMPFGDFYAYKEWLEGEAEQLVMVNWETMTMFIHRREAMRELFKSENGCQPQPTGHDKARYSIHRGVFVEQGGVIEPIHPEIVEVLEI